MPLVSPQAEILKALADGSMLKSAELSSHTGAATNTQVRAALIAMVRKGYIQKIGFNSPYVFKITDPGRNALSIDTGEGIKKPEQIKSLSEIGLGNHEQLNQYDQAMLDLRERLQTPTAELPEKHTIITCLDKLSEILDPSIANVLRQASEFIKKHAQDCSASEPIINQPQSERRA